MDPATSRQAGRGLEEPAGGRLHQGSKDPPAHWLMLQLQIESEPAREEDKIKSLIMIKWLKKTHHSQRLLQAAAGSAWEQTGGGGEWASGSERPALSPSITPSPSPTPTPGPGPEGSPTRAVEWNKAPVSLWRWGHWTREPGARQIQVQTQALPVTSCVTQEATEGFQASVSPSGPQDDACPVGCGLEQCVDTSSGRTRAGCPWEQPAWGSGRELAGGNFKQ